MESPATVHLRMDGIQKRFGSRRVLTGIALTAEGGEAIAVIGPNGSGKSTLLKIVAGLQRATRGSVTLTVDGADVSEPGLRRRSVGYVAPDLMLYPELTGRENLAFFAAVRGVGGIEAAIARRLDDVGLGGRGDDALRTYSSGMRQRLRLALATLFAPPVLLLDEAGLALDDSGVALVARIVAEQRARGALTLLATNDGREATLGDRSIVLGG